MSTTTTTTSIPDTPLGSGSIAIIVLIGISFIICVLSRGTTAPLLVSFLGALLPIIAFIIMYLYPKETSTKDKSQDSRICCNSQYIYRVVYLIILILTAVMCIFWRFKLDVLDSHYARKAPTGFLQKRQEEYQKQKELLRLVKEQGDDDQQGLLDNQAQDNDFSKNQGPNFVDLNQNKPKFGVSNQKKIF